MKSYRTIVCLSKSGKSTRLEGRSDSTTTCGWARCIHTSEIDIINQGLGDNHVCMTKDALKLVQICLPDGTILRWTPGIDIRQIAIGLSGHIEKVLRKSCQYFHIMRPRWPIISVFDKRMLLSDPCSSPAMRNQFNQAFSRLNVYGARLRRELSDQWGLNSTWRCRTPCLSRKGTVQKVK